MKRKAIKPGSDGSVLGHCRRKGFFLVTINRGYNLLSNAKFILSNGYWKCDRCCMKIKDTDNFEADAKKHVAAYQCDKYAANQENNRRAQRQPCKKAVPKQF
jgi:hypothetical protein